MIEVFFSTDGKHTVHVQAQTQDEMNQLLPYGKSVYQKIVNELGTKAEMWDKAINGNGKERQPVANFGKRIDTPEQAEEMFAPKCSIHKTPMKKRNGQYGEFWSCGTKQADGSWCKESAQV